MLSIYQNLSRLKLSWCLFILSLLLPLQAHSSIIQVEYDGDLYNVTTQSTYAGASNQVWWRDMSIASYFANEVADAFGYPNVDAELGNFSGRIGSAFVTDYQWGISGRPWYAITASCFNELSQVAETCIDSRPGGNPYQDVFYSFAVATKVSEVPLPATVWLFGSAMLGLMGLASRKKA